MAPFFSNSRAAAVNPHFAHDALLPRAPGGMGAGAVLALLAHAVLLAALTSTVQWRTRAPEVFSAELWSAVPQAAAPQAAPPPPVVAPPPAPVPVPKVEPPPKPVVAPPAPPPPPQRDAEIAIEQARKAEALRKAQEQEAAKAEAEKAKAKAKADAEELRKTQEAERKAAKAKRDAEAESKKLEEAKRKKEAEDQRKAAAEAKAEDDKLAKQRDENLRRMMGQAGSTGSGTNPGAGTGGTGTAAQSSAPSASYVGRLIALIKPNIVFTGQVEGNPSAEVEVRAAAGGSILSKRLVKSSGNKEWDEAVLRAIDRTATLPRDTDGRVPTPMVLVFRPEG